MLTLADAFVRIRPDMGGFGQELQTKASMGADNVGKGVGKKVGVGIMAGLAGAFAVAQVTKFFKDAFNEAQEAAKVTALTNSVIKSTGGIANVTAKSVTALADRLSDLAGVDDEVIQSAENVLLTFTRVRNEAGKGNDIFDQSTKAALDLSAALGTDLQAATILVGKALNDPIGGLTALKKAGIQFTDAQKDQIKAMVEAGDVMGAQKMVLRELTTEFGGAAAAAATPADKAAVAWKNFEEDVGSRLLPMLNSILTFGLANQRWLVPLATATTEMAVAVGLVVAASKSWSAVQSVLGVGLEGNIGKIKKATAAIGGLLVVTQLVNASIGADLNPNLDDLGDSLVKFGKTGKLSGEVARIFGDNMQTLSDSLGQATSSQRGFFLGMENLIPGVASMDSAWTKGTARIQALDGALAQLTEGGHADDAAAAFKRIWEQAQAADVPLDKLQAAFPQYVAAAAKAAKGTDQLATAAKGAAAAGKTLLDTWNELHGAMSDADHAALAAQTAIDGLKETFKENGKSIKGNTAAALGNRVALEDAAAAAADAATKYLANGGSAAGAAAMMNKYEDAAVKSTGATGKAKDAVKAFADTLFKLPAEKVVTLTANVHVNGAAQLNRVIKEMSLHGLSAGGVMQYFAQGGESHVAQIVKAATVRVWAEPETGGEAYIPLAAGKRARSTEILSDVANRFGYALVPTGGGPGTMSIGGDGAPPTAGAASAAPRSPLHIENFYAAPSHSEYRLAQELDWLARGGG
jgi:hypothetical protein